MGGLIHLDNGAAEGRNTGFRLSLCGDVECGLVSNKDILHHLEHHVVKNTSLFTFGLTKDTNG